MRRIQTYQVYPKRGSWAIRGPKGETDPYLLFSTQLGAIRKAEQMALYGSEGLQAVSICGKNGKERTKYRIFSITRVVRVPIKK